MVDAVVSLAVEKLVDFLSQEIGLPERLRNDVEWLSKELEYMQSFLEDARQRERSADHRVEMWVSDITNVAAEAVDILEKFTGDSRRSKLGLTDCLRLYACICSSKEPGLHSVAGKMESLKARVLDISRKRETYGIRDIKSVGEGPSGCVDNKSMIRRFRRATSFADEEELFVGVEDVFETLLKALLQSEPRRSVVSIYGMGGLGKTTLARKLYSAATVKGNFPYRAWVCVSQEYSPPDVLRTIIKSFKKGCSREELEMLEKMNEEDLERFLHEFLEEQRYLVVIDDVWSKEAWKSLRRAFPERKNGSRVIVTTRIKEVAQRVDDRTFAQELRFLSREESWDLFCKKISHREGHTNWCSAAALDHGKAMVDKCGGLPLAIIVLGGLLSHKRGLGDWRKVKEHIWGHLKNDSIEIEHILSLSYDELSDELKRCFLYFGMFPEDYLIITEKLIWLWMADELIPSGDERMEDIAKDFLQELFNRSLIQVAEWYRGMTVGCRIHDLLRDLAVEKASQLSFFGIYDPRKHSNPLLGSRLAIHNQVGKHFSDCYSNPRLRSVVVFNPDKESIETEKLTSACHKFRYLRVLDLEDVRINGGDFGPVALPDAIGDLIHLKYLGLFDVAELPPSIGNLANLQTLHIHLVHRVPKGFPREISKLLNLRHFYARPMGAFQFGNLTNLRTLRYVRYAQWVENDVANLINLRELAIEDIHKLDGKAYSLGNIGKLSNLETLSLRCPIRETFPQLEPLSTCQNLLALRLKGRIRKLPPPDKWPQSLTMLALSYTKLKEDPMPVLGRLPNLTNLLLEGFYDGKKMTCHADGFPQLESLYLLSLDELELWELAEGAMSMLRGLEVDDCPMLRIPQRLKLIPKPKDSLKTVSGKFVMISDRYPFL